MSKFFRKRSTDSDTSSSSSSPSGEEEHAEEIDQHDLSIQQDLSDLSLDPINYGRPVAVTGGSAGQAWLLHALLEERCRNQVRSEGRFNTEDEIQREGRRRYQLLCRRLAPFNLVSTGLDHDRYINTRQGIRDRLDSVNVNAPVDSNALQLQNRSPPATSPLPAPLRRLLTNGGPPSAPASPASLFDGSSTLAVTDRPARYLADFEELGPLGKGGYGEVFRVRHILDQRIYAVKKVPIKPALLAKIRSGEASLDDALREIRCLSNFDHPNVVRYYSSWIEWSTRTSLVSNSSELDSPVPAGGARVDRSDAVTSLGRVRTESDAHTDDMADIGFESRSHLDTSVALDSVEESSLQSPSSTNEALLPTSTLPLLTLHMQMDVYPMTLGDFIDPKPTGTEIAPLSHCFHLETSIRILLAIFEGVEYLHSKSVVHRDLKPANIFLKHEGNPRAAHGTVDLFLCSTCRNENRAQPAQLSVRIGDFGLVTNIAQTTQAIPSHGVGTELYRPTATTSNVTPRLDIFAVGIIACELLCKFGTQSERRQKLDGLRRGRFPEFVGCPSHQSAKLQEVIKTMLTDEVVTIAELKGRLGELLEQSGLHASAVLGRVST
ncbi:serine threonine- kinase GCN2 [Lecanosticta acicola]|uniref:Serine threonine- kinase GCN2 n=1 Tax=Lecanosticta acicola TaxID=111012 RepID=A0AAI8Z0Y2_9PEZI|nr:serine threonine- kinase GCN2 [Lecanosticta acicola]